MNRDMLSRRLEKRIFSCMAEDGQQGRYVQKRES